MINMINSNLKRLRKNYKYTQEEVAEKINVSRQSVAKRVYELGAGIILKKDNVKCIKDATLQIMYNNKYRENANKLSISFKNAGGAKKAADKILKVIDDRK